MKKKVVTKKSPAKIIHLPPEEVKHELPAVQSPDSMIAMAINKGMDIGTLERLMELRDKEIARQAKMEFINAMVRFQQMIPDLFKNKKVDYESKSEGGGKVKYNYQDLGSIIRCIKDAEAACGLTHGWEQSEKDNEITVVCVISHIGGHVQRGEPLTGNPDKTGKKEGLHAKASTITYLQRYTLKGALGLTSTESDDDGQLGNKNASKASELPWLKPEQMQGTVNQILKGIWTVAIVKEKVQLTTDQEILLQKIQDEKVGQPS